MTTSQLNLIVAGIKIKLARGEFLEDILGISKNLTENEKNYIRTHFNS